MKASDHQALWFVIGPERKQYGPYPISKLLSYALDGRLAPDQLVCQRGMSGWVQARTLPELKSAFGVPAIDRARGETRDPGPPDARMPQLTPAWVVEKALDQTKSSVTARLMMLFNDLSGYAIVAGGLLAIGAAVLLLIESMQERAGTRTVTMYAGLIFGIAVTQYVGLRMSAVSSRTIARSTVTISNSAILDIIGITFVALLVASLALAGVWAYETDSPKAVVAASLGAPLLIVGSIFAFNPQILGIRVSESGSLGEDGVAILGLPTRACLASAGIASGSMSMLGGCTSLLGAVSAARPRSLEFIGLDDFMTRTDLMWAGIAYVMFAGLWPLVIYVWSAIEHLWLGMFEAIHAVGRQARQSSANQDQGRADRET